MDRQLIDFLGGRRRRRAGRWTLRVLPAQALLEAKWEAEHMELQEEEKGLAFNACLVAKAAHLGPWRAFSGGGTVLRKLSAEDIGRLAAEYHRLCRAESPSCCQSELSQWQERLAGAGYERLKWRILKSFGVLPSEARAKKMTDGDYLYCAVQTTLDERERQERLCPACRQAAEEDRCIQCGGPLEQRNESFDAGRFEELKKNGIS